jgi:hypothetical protein
MSLSPWYPADEWAAAAATQGARPNLANIKNPEWRSLIERAWEASPVLRLSSRELVAGPVRDRSPHREDATFLPYLGE